MWIFLCAFAFQIAVVERLADSWHFPPSANDTGFYQDWARKIRGDIPWKAGEMNSPGTAFYGMPGYPYALAGIFSVTGGFHQERSPVIVALVQAAMQAGTATLLFLLGLRLFSRRPEGDRQGFWLGLLASVLWMLFVPAQIFSAVYLSSAWLVLGFWMILHQIITREACRAHFWFWMGLALGFLAMFAASVLVLLPLLCIAIEYRTLGKGWIARRRRCLAGFALLLAGMALGASPCWLHNFWGARDPVLFSGHDGVNFYIGNHAGADGYTNIPPELPSSQRELLEDSISIAERELGRSPLLRATISQFWKERALLWITHNPFSWVRLLYLKIDNYWNGFQYDDLSLLRSLEDSNLPLPGLRWAHLAPLALAGLLSVRRWKGLGWAAGAVLLVMAGLLPVFVTERYRLPAAPGLILLSIGGVAWLWEKCRVRSLPGIAIYATALLAAAIWTTQPRALPYWSLDYYNDGVRSLDIAQGISESDGAPLVQQAQESLERALAFAPNDSNILLALGNVWFLRGIDEKAKDCFERAVTANRSNFRALGNLAQSYGRQNHWAEALPLLEEAVSLDPDNFLRWLALAQANEHLGHLTEARKAIQSALRLKPGDPQLMEISRRLWQR